MTALSGILDAAWPDARLHFWNVQGRHEVDFVIEDGTEAVSLGQKLWALPLSLIPS